MIPVTTAAHTAALDRALIDGLGIPGRVLMELAGHGVAQKIHRRWPEASVVVLCGPGNNGGDGYVIARWLALWSHPVRLWAAGPPTTPDAQANRQLMPATVQVVPDVDDAVAGAEVVVDALLGTGQRAAPRGAILDGLRALANVPVRVAVDLPTGLCSDTGQALCASLASFQLTVTIGRHKPGLWASPGHQRCGEIELVDIGMSQIAAPLAGQPDAQLLESRDIAAWLPTDRADSAKWNRGHVAIMAGGGAGVLAAHGAFRSGCGLVSLLAPRADWPALHGLWPEVILAEPDALNPRRHDALVIGPGLGLDQLAALTSAWQSFPSPVLADADALTMLAAHPLPPLAGSVRAWTPHVAEAARLLGLTVDQISADRFGAARSLARDATTLLKGPCSLIASHTAAGTSVFVNPTGSVRLATAGSGDVLAGLAGGFLARGLSAAQALSVAAWTHGQAGERLLPGSTASDLLSELRTLFDQAGSV